MKRKNNMSMRTNYSGFGMAAIMLFLFSVPVLAQQKKDKKLESENVDIVRDYKPKILDAAKIEVLPEPEKLEVRKPEMKYFTTNSLFPTQPYKTPFRTLQISKGEQEPLQHAYVKAALGNYNNIYAEGFVNTLYKC